MLAIALFTTDLRPGIRGVGAGVFGRIYHRYEKSNSWLPITNFLSATFDLYPKPETTQTHFVQAWSIQN